MRKRIYFIDLENVGKKGLSGLETLKSTDELYIAHNRCIAAEISKAISDALQLTKASVHIVYLDNPYKNAMDFNICMLLGTKVQENGTKADYYIVSKDKAYDVVTDYVKTINQDIVANRIVSIEDMEKANREQQELINRIKYLLNNNYTKYELDMILRAKETTQNRTEYYHFLEKHIRGSRCQTIFALTKSLVPYKGRVYSLSSGELHRN